MNTKLFLASIATATTLAAPGAFASELYGAVDLTTGQAGSSQPIAFENDGRVTGALYGFETVRPAAASQMAKSFDTRVEPTGVLYGFEIERAGDVGGAPMTSMSQERAGFVVAGGELYGSIGEGTTGSRLVAAVIPADGPLGRGALYGFESGATPAGGVTVQMADIGPQGPQTRGALYGFEGDARIGATSLGE